MNMTTQEFIRFCKHQHDVECNQKYGKDHPYSFHLDLVATQAKKFEELLGDFDLDLDKTIMAACYGHDLIEDARVTYNDIKEMVGEKIADIIYCCTEEKGKNRDQRHSEKYFSELKENELAIFVKICDITANVKYSLLTDSGMLKKYRKEFPKVKEHLYVEKFKPLFDHLESILLI